MVTMYWITQIPSGHVEETGQLPIMTIIPSKDLQ